MNIGICLHPIDPAIRGGDHRVSQTQTEHDISLTSASQTHTWKPHTCEYTHLQVLSPAMDKKCEGNVVFHLTLILRDRQASYLVLQRLNHANTQVYTQTIANKHNTRAHTHSTTLLWGGLLDPYCPLARLASLCLSSSTDAWGITCLPPQIQGQITMDQLPNLNC